jgi:glycosyltransferase involved in cell wall biosynthesis
MNQPDCQVSIVVPLLNERDNVRELVESVEAVMKQAGTSFELIAVDDGSTDGTVDILRELLSTRPWLSIIQLRRNFGQTAAMSAGFDHARGAVIVPLDGDLQNDPADIPRLISRLEEGYDVVSGWRRERKDKFFTRILPSRLANYLIGKITGVPLHDYGCSLKAYRKEVVSHTRLYGEMHRFIPALASWAGASVTELPVNHRPRVWGRSKYGLNRIVKVLLDLATVKFLGSFSTKPIHVFGGVGLLMFLGAVLSGATVLYQKFFSEARLSMNRNPLLILTALFIMTAVQFLLMGLLAEMLARTYHESQQKPTYVIRRIFLADDRTAPGQGPS